MKIGIFGDSWAKTIVSAEGKKFHDGYAWWELLSAKYDVTNFGIPGSSVYFSYEEFNKHYSNFDKIIFLATEPGRLTFEVGSEIKNPRLAPEFKRHCNSYGTADYYSKVFNNSRFPEDSARINAAKEYFLWIQNKKEQSEYKRLMLNEIKNLRPDALILNPAHAWDDVKHQVITCLLNISNMEIDHFGKGSLQDLMSQGYTDIRPCHLTRENNKILADKITNWIEHSMIPSFNKDDFVLPSDGIELCFEIKKPA
jgi:hypothetical protein